MLPEIDWLCYQWAMPAKMRICSAGKTSGVLRVGAFGANRGYVLAHCAKNEKNDFYKIQMTERSHGFWVNYGWDINEK